jgi:hypothetical protein
MKTGFLDHNLRSNQKLGFVLVLKYHKMYRNKKIGIPNFLKTQYVASGLELLNYMLTNFSG